VEFYDPQFAIHSATPEVRRMVANLLQGYAETNGHEYEADSDEGLPGTVRLYEKDDRDLIAEISLITEDPRSAIQALSENTPDISIVDQQQFTSQLPIVENVDPANLEQVLLAYDGTVLIGHQENPVQDLDVLDIAQIWNGTNNSWRSLGGGDFPIAVHMVGESATTGSDAKLWLSTFGQSNLNGIVTHNTEAEVIEAVQADRNAIGVVHRAAAQMHHAKMFDLRKSCGLTASPTDFDMQIEHYPLSLPVNAYGQSASMHPVAKSFLDWAQTFEAQRHVAPQGFVSTQLQRTKMRDMGVSIIHTAAVEPDFDGREFASMMRELRDADRLSISFRFLPGSSSLDDESVENIKDLATRLRRSEFDGQEVLLVGFADSVGPADRNTVLSERRAEAVRTVLEAEFEAETRDKLNIQVLSFGEQMPLDCNDTDDGRANNRRVEVWTRVAN
jgi:phosphate transport system substrate-binding protein